ncbi:hypothetical protein [Pseudonocardia sp.]|uniref:hypothetical protein n=1 Tax=Pseudonocardia sp. TaxID=60912 RepID=UPI003D0FCD7B
MTTRTSRTPVGCAHTEPLGPPEPPEREQAPEPTPNGEPRGLLARLRDVSAAVGAAHREGVPF